MDKRDMKFSEMDVIAHCKQCGGPITSHTKVLGPTGVFCSEVCREKHENFVQRAAALESPERKRSTGYITWLRIRGTVARIVAILVLIVFMAAVFTEAVNVPVLTPFFTALRRLVGL